MTTYFFPPGMDFHEDLSRLGEKEGLKGRKLNKAVESFTWNITVLKVTSKHLEFCNWYMSGFRWCQDTSVDVKFADFYTTVTKL